jgi:hypothetical protein
MPNYACIKDETVVNILVFEEDAVELKEQIRLELDYDLLVDINDQPVVVGDGYVNSDFVLSNPILEDDVTVIEEDPNAPVRLTGVPYIPE